MTDWLTRTADESNIKISNSGLISTPNIIDHLKPGESYDSFQIVLINFNYFMYFNHTKTDQMWSRGIKEKLKHSQSGHTTTKNENSMIPAGLLHKLMLGIYIQVITVFDAVNSLYVSQQKNWAIFIIM